MNKDTLVDIVGGVMDRGDIDTEVMHTLYIYRPDVFYVEAKKEFDKYRVTIYIDQESFRKDKPWLNFQR
jgi:hypothetical protein